MKKILINIKTSLFGAIAGLPLIIDGVSGKDWTKIASGIGALLVGLFAKDSDVH